MSYETILVETRGSGEAAAHALPAEDQAAEYLMMSLRLAEGTDLTRLARLGLTLEPAALTELEDLGLVARDGPRLKATLAGRRVLNAVLRTLMVS